MHSQPGSAAAAASLSGSGKPPRYYAEDAWLRALRAFRPTRHVYSCNPHVEVYPFRENLYGLMFSLLDTGGFGWMWLIDGPEKAMLIDTGYGLGDLRGLCSQITAGKPLIVANTHCSCDHSYGNCQFEQVYCHELQVADLNWKQDPRIWDYLINEDDSCLCVPFDRADIVPFRTYQVIGVPDGYRFNLGQGYEIELIWTPGHQPGHAAYLDRQGRFLIGGDCICCGDISISGGSDFHADPRHARDLFQGSCYPSGDPRHARDLFQGSCYPSGDPRRTVAAQREGLLRLSARLDDFDRAFCGHGIQDFSSKLVPDLIETCDKILAHPEAFGPSAEGGRCSAPVKGGGHICFNQNGVHFPKGTEV
ncbi:MAG: MBL fold metallo-hydrolase [Candidatus Onthomonas sp.]